MQKNEKYMFCYMDFFLRRQHLFLKNNIINFCFQKYCGGSLFAKIIICILFNLRMICKFIFNKK